jgi:hypothetical protein
MKKNVGGIERAMRGFAGAVMLSAGLWAPLPWAVRLVGLGAMGAYMLFTAVAGTCFGYRLMGRSTCPVNQHL